MSRRGRGEYIPLNCSFLRRCTSPHQKGSLFLQLKGGEEKEEWRKEKAGARQMPQKRVPRCPERGEQEDNARLWLHACPPTNQQHILFSNALLKAPFVGGASPLPPCPSPPFDALITTTPLPSPIKDPPLILMPPLKWLLFSLSLSLSPLAFCSHSDFQDTPFPMGMGSVFHIEERLGSVSRDKGQSRSSVSCMACCFGTLQNRGGCGGSSFNCVN